MMYNIWSWRNRMWWKANRQGYTPNLPAAGTYTREESADIMFHGLPGSNTAVDVGLEPRFINLDADEVEQELNDLRRL